MPEGDTIHTLAETLAPELCGQRIESLAIRHRPQSHPHKTHIETVKSRGKHLIIELSDGRTIRSHLGLYGSWHRYRPGEPWQRPARQASLVIRLAERLYVCFNAKEVEITASAGFRIRDQQHRLGPDLTREPLIAEQLQSRIKVLVPSDTPIVDLLLDQRIASGIGNVYKSEVLFLRGISPRAEVETLRPDDILGLYETAARLLRSNLAGSPRITRDCQDGRGNLWVYRRRGLACFHCGRPILQAMLGRTPRSTYWCPGCQSSTTARQPA